MILEMRDYVNFIDDIVNKYGVEIDCYAWYFIKKILYDVYDKPCSCNSLANTETRIVICQNCSKRWIESKLIKKENI